MSSLTTKLTLAFLVVGALGVALFAVLVGLQARSEFNRFLSKRDQEMVVDALSEYYAASRTWDGLGRALAARPAVSFNFQSAVVLDGSGNVIVTGQAIRPGTRVSDEVIGQALPISVGGDVVGSVAFVPPTTPDGRRPPSPMELDFIRRALIAALISGAVTILASLLVGSLLANTLSRPIRDLTDATRAMASGDLHQEVQVRSSDEIGALAHSFNLMSADLARASVLRKQMTADLAHDLRTPLSLLRGYTEGLAEQRIHGSPQIYDLMHGEVIHLQRLVEDLRTLSLADAGELHLSKRTVDPRALLERAALAYMPVAEERGLELKLDAPESLPSVNVDTDRMAQVLNNLVSNALRHTAQGSVTLGSRLAGDRVLIEVRDTGSGIEAADLPNVFDRFYRGDKARQRTGQEDGASGLGLAIAKAIVEAHGGSIGVTSAPGSGTSFQIALPVKQEA